VLDDEGQARESDSWDHDLRPTVGFGWRCERCTG
jgi:hypothetical protein